MSTVQRRPPVLSPSELLLLSSYPIILILGSLYSALSSPASHILPKAPSYFAQKSNILNVYFVKLGWAWTSAAFLGVFNVRARHQSAVEGFINIRSAKALARYLVVTTWWIAVTQWFFGPAIIDRSFRLTGGNCQLEVESSSTVTIQHITAATCKAAGGRWNGGHDISGHVFLLVLGSAFLMLEAMPRISASALSTRRKWQKKDDEKQHDDGVDLGLVFLAIVVGLCLWMLLMTAVYFHTWIEKVSPQLALPIFDKYSCLYDLRKLGPDATHHRFFPTNWPAKLTGLLVAYAALGTAYLLPRVFTPAHAILGSPLSQI